MANDPVSQMVSDPDFPKLSLDEQRKALTAHDAAFGGIADDQLQKFVQAHQGPQFQIPNATAQARQTVSNIIPTEEAYRQDPRLRNVSLPQGSSPAQVASGENEYQRQAGQLPMQTAAGMATGGLFPAIQGGGLLKNILPFLGRTGTSAAAMGAGTLAAGGTPQEVKGAAEGGAIGQPISEGVSAALPWMAKGLKNAAVSQYQRALSPTTKVNKAITQKITPQLIDQGVHGSLESIGEQAGQQATALRPQLDTAYGATPAAATVGSGSQILQDLENLKGKYTVQGMPANPSAVNAISGVQDVVKQYGNDIAPESLRKLKQIFDDPVAARGGYAGADLTTAYTLKAQKAAANSIRGIMEQASPDVADLNKQISFWLDVQRVTSQTAQRRAGQEGGLVKTLALPFLTGTGVLAGMHGGIEGASAGFLTTAATLAVRSPAWRTASAVLKDRFADALARGSVADASGLLAKLGVTNLGSQQSPQPPWGRQNTTAQPLPQPQR